MSKEMFEVADGIMDSAIDEYRAENLKSIESVQDYAEYALEIYLSRDEAAYILRMCRDMQARLDAGEISSTMDWYLFEQALIEF